MNFRERLARFADRPDECWEWPGAVNHSGYGMVGVKTNGRWKCRSTHRAAYELLVGPVPPGLDIDHTCRNRHCMNPRHMEPVTERENTLRGEGPAGKNARKTHCDRGHPFTRQNTYKYRSGGRRCRTCFNEWNRAYLRSRYHERKARAT